MLPGQAQADLLQRQIHSSQGLPVSNMKFVQADAFPRENQKNYVFVDEHNRHKRLKVMRACEGCRRRKIKCDAATTNTWPCSACKRLKLNCVPPTVHYDKGFPLQQLDFADEYDGPSSGEEDFFIPQAQVPQHGLRRSTSTGSLPQFLGRDFAIKSAGQLSMQPSSQFLNSLPFNGISHQQQQQQQLAMNASLSFPTSQMYTSPPPVPQSDAGQTSWRAESPATTFNTAHVREVLGHLKIEDTGVASYIHSQSRDLASAPAYEAEDWDDYEQHPIYNPGIHDFAVRIRPEDMPSDHEAEKLIQIYFNDIHPYMPIVNKNAFNRQWRTSRHSISPLLLEAIFASAGRISNNPKDGLRWLSMASKHLDCFFDVPRMSTVQALLLLLKARESAPQRGYFFRSYISVVTMMAMARDLGLDKHADLHKAEAACLDGPLECITKTRVWQACFMLECMICAPQGRHIMASDPATVEMPASSLLVDMDEKEVQTYVDFTYLFSLLKLIRRMNDIFARLKISNNWAGDPEFLTCGPSFDQWFLTLPSHLQVDVPIDVHVPMPSLNDHFSGNLLIYGHLARIMFHRPALAFARNFSATGHWRAHLKDCYDSSRKACRLTEQILEQFGIRGLQCMLRGINFTIYAMLTATMVNLVAATCPDPEFNLDAREYFSRSMRILEVCIDISASMEAKGQIEALRAAFSQDISQPFVLNTNFPFYTSPSNGHMSSPSASAHESYSPVDTTQSPVLNAMSATMNNRVMTLSPPHSDTGESPVPSMIMMNTTHSAQNTPQRKRTATEAGWNPARILEHWNTGFPGLASAPLPPPQMSAVPQNALVETLIPATGYLPPTIPVVTPDVWQSTVAQVFSGTKRSWQYANQ